MTIEEYMMLDGESLTHDRFVELMESNSKDSLTGSEIAELTVYLVQLGLYFWLEKRRQAGRTDSEISDDAIRKHQRNKEELQNDIEEIDEPQYP